jgi:hypothetical protein
VQRRRRQFDPVRRKVAGFEQPQDCAIGPKISIAGWAFWGYERTLGQLNVSDELGFGHDGLLY